MNKKIKAQIIMEVVGAIAFASLGFVYFTGYGGNNCDQPPALTCDCFCCHLFNSRGYESCGIFGLILGYVVLFVMNIFSLFLAI